MISRLLLSLITVLVLSIPEYIQAQNIDWANTYGGMDSDVGNSIAVDKMGNVYTLGSYSLQMDADPGNGVYMLNSKGSYDVYVQKLDSSGNFLWAVTIGGKKHEFASALALDDFGNVFIVGGFEDTLTNGSEVGSFQIVSKGLSDVFVIKLDSSGNSVWGYSIGGSIGHDFSTGTAIAENGDIYVYGRVNGVVDFDPGIGTKYITAQTHGSYFIQKVNAAGELIWAEKWEGLGILDLLVEKEYLLVVGVFYPDTVDFDPGPLVKNVISNQFSGYILKLDTSANFVWVKTLSSTSGRNSISNIASDDFGNIYVAGSFNNTVDFDPGVKVHNNTSKGQSDGFTLKLDSMGSYQWVAPIGGARDDISNYVAVDHLGNVYSVGAWDDYADLDPGPDTLIDSYWVGYKNVFLQKLNGNGKLIYAHTIASNVENYANSMALDNDANVYIMGNFTDSVFFDLGDSIVKRGTSSASDIYIVKYSPKNCFKASLESAQTCSSFTSARGNTYTQSGIHHDTILNPVGCDSVIVINLILARDLIEDSVQIVGTTLISQAKNASYQWLDCGNGFIPIIGEVDSSYTATVNGSYAVVITENGCSDTSNCMVINNIGLFENELSSNNLSLYPNPTSGKITLSGIQLHETYSYRLLDSKGQSIQEGIFDLEKEFEEEIKGASGLYVLELFDAKGEVKRFKIFKN